MWSPADIVDAAAAGLARAAQAMDLEDAVRGLDDLPEQTGGIDHRLPRLHTTGAALVDQRDLQTGVGRDPDDLRHQHVLFK